MPIDNNENKEFKPVIVAFCCNWCSYAGADLAGSSRLSYPADVKIIRVPCSCRVHPLRMPSGRLPLQHRKLLCKKTYDPAVLHAGLHGR